MTSEEMDVPEVCARLAKAISLQIGSLTSITLLAGTVTGPAAASLKRTLREYAAAEVEDTVRLVEKLVALGGAPGPYESVSPTSPHPVSALADFLEREEALLAALHAVIEPSGQEPRSEALEHRVEHVLLRKQDQVDFLRLALERPQEGNSPAQAVDSVS
jgi:hypothetical protein